MHGVLMHFPIMNAYGCKENMVSVYYLYVCHVCVIIERIVSISYIGNKPITSKLSLPILLLHEVIRFLS